MKTVLDFSKVPLDKWVDLYTAVDSNSHVFESASDIKRFATTQVKEQSDYDKEVAEACATYFSDSSSHDNYLKLADALKARSEAPKEDSVDKEAHSKRDEKDLPF